MFSPVVVVSALIIGLVLGLLGAGGSIVTVPLLVYVVGLDPKIAIATSLLVVGLASSAALVSHARAGNVLWRTGLLFGVAGMLGAYLGGRGAAFIPGTVLLILFAVVMLGSAISMMRRPRPQIDKRESPTDRQGLPIFRILTDGFVVGAVTGLVGAGGGFLVVPALVLFGRLAMHMAVGTSLLVIAMKSFAGLAGHLGHVSIDLRVAVLVGGLAVAGTLAGTRVSRFVSGDNLRMIFGWFVLIVAMVLLYREGMTVLCDQLSMQRGSANMLLLGLAVLAIIGGVRWWLRSQTIPPIGVR